MVNEFQQLLTSRKNQVETVMLALLSDADNETDISGLAEAMRYGACGGGKRLRASLVLESAKLAGADTQNTNPLHVAAALEMVHGYSLIHDDLPAMDDDELRHGKPCVHLAFDEATAILAGDSLLTFAFEILARSETHADAQTRINLVQILARASGHQGMAAGQYLDMQLQGNEATDEAQIIRLQSLKTGALFVAATQAGAHLGNPSPRLLQGLQNYAEKLGLAFQIYDDVLDSIGDAKQMGKNIGKDSKFGKPSFLAINSVEKAREKAYALRDEAVAQSKTLTGTSDNFLAQLAHFAVSRNQ
ncbi:MAG: polyprenyl synthetase family protein [Alphaproteobacteria bacterium]|nr:polyprenyl synthetase family protein [Alphaproteobacteria bacterium]